MALHWAEIIAKNVKQLLREKGFSQPELAQKAGIEQSQVSRAVTGKMDNPKLGTLDAIARTAGRDAVWLLTDPDAPARELDPRDAFHLVEKYFLRGLERAPARTLRAAEPGPRPFDRILSLLENASPAQLSQVEQLLAEADDSDLQDPAPADDAGPRGAKKPHK